MLKFFLQEDEIYINAAKIIEISGWHDCQRISNFYYQIVKFSSLGKKIQLWTNVNHEESSSRSGLQKWSS